MRTLFLDCFSGLSGDMAVGALLDLGVDAATLRGELGKLGLDAEFHLHVSRVERCQIAATKFDVHLPHEHSHEHPHTHDHHHHDHQHEHAHSHEGHAHSHAHGRGFAEIRRLIEASTLSPFVRERAVATFRRIAVAEGKIHGLPPDDVHFHEVGAIDSIVDIVGFCVGLEALGVPRVLASQLVEGRGFIPCAHGQFPLPAPATLEILAGIPLRQVDEPGEFLTPTGAAILAEFAEGFGPMPALAAERIGYGAGTRNPAHRPNVVRAVLGSVAAADTDRDLVTEIEANLDDLSPELLAAATTSLLAAGALDVWVTPILMKKGRPAQRLSVLVEPARAAEFARRILRETTAFGVRMHDCRRLKLQRDTVTAGTEFGPVTIKRGWLDGELVQLAPEFESCRTVAEHHGISVREVYTAAVRAAQGP